MSNNPTSGRCRQRCSPSCCLRRADWLYAGWPHQRRVRAKFWRIVFRGSDITGVPPFLYCLGLISGALDELSQLRILIAHGGGFAPYQIGRFDCAHRNRSSVSINTKTSPRDLLRRFYFDALIRDPKSLRLLIDQVGSNHIAIGTDNPFDMGYQDPLGELDKVQNLTSDERECICCRTAESLLGEG